MNYLSDLSKLLKSELSEVLNMFGYYKFLTIIYFTKDERKILYKAKKTAEAFAAYNKKYGLLGRGFNDFE